MNIKQTQQGMTFWGIMAFLSLAIFFGILAFRLLPIYMDDLKVSKAMDRLIHSEERGRDALVKQFGKQLGIDDVKDINYKDLKLEPRGNGFFAKLDYEIRVPIIYNIDAVLTFAHQRDIP